jgi:hypothetical protein
LGREKEQRPDSNRDRTAQIQQVKSREKDESTSHEDIHEEREDHIKTNGQHRRRETPHQMVSRWGDLIQALKELIQDLRAMPQPNDEPRD